jgi:hypothetical protein
MTKPANDELPDVEGAELSRVDDGHIQIKVDKSLVAGLVLAGINLVRRDDLHPSVVIMAMIQAAWAILDITTDYPIEKRREMLAVIIRSMTEESTPKDTIQ